MNGRIGRLASIIKRAKMHSAGGGESHLLYGCDGHRRADPLVRSANSLTTTCGHFYCLRLRSFQQPAAASQDHQAACVYRVWSHQPADAICIPVQGLCLCTQTGSAWWVRSSPSSKHVHGFAIGSCPARQGEGCQGGLRTVDLSRDGQCASRRDLQGPY